VLGLLLQSLLVASHEDERHDGDVETEHDRNGSDWFYQPMYIVTWELTSQSVRNPCTLDGNKEQRRPVVVYQKMCQLGCGKMEHVNCAFSISPPAFKR